MSKNTKTTIKFFLLPDYEKEEAYLSKMHSNGWKVKRIDSFIHKFEKCEPENVVYRIDFADKKRKDMDSYKNMFAEYGWEYIQDMNDFSYFRQSADGLSDEDSEIFSDNESRLEMIKRIIRKKLLFIWFIFLVILVPGFLDTVNGKTFNGEYHLARDVFYIATFSIYFYMTAYCMVKFSMLKRRYSKK